MLTAARWLGLVSATADINEASESLKTAVRKSEVSEFCHLLKCLSTDPKFVDRLAEPLDRVYTMADVAERIVELQSPKPVPKPVPKPAPKPVSVSDPRPGVQKPAKAVGSTEKGAVKKKPATAGKGAVTGAKAASGKAAAAPTKGSSSAGKSAGSKSASGKGRR
jgi:hypothetical protein